MFDREGDAFTEGLTTELVIPKVKRLKHREPSQFRGDGPCRVEEATNMISELSYPGF